MLLCMPRLRARRTPRPTQDLPPDRNKASREEKSRPARGAAHTSLLLAPAAGGEVVRSKL
jgi:hypothetical protein